MKAPPPQRFGGKALLPNAQHVSDEDSFDPAKFLPTGSCVSLSAGLLCCSFENDVQQSIN